jgi:hypothetical protein
VDGKITIDNNIPFAATITGVSDSVSGLVPASADCGVSFPYTLPSGDTLVCSYNTGLPNGTNRTNTATVTTSGDPYLILAHQYIAAELNVFNGSSIPTDVADAWTEAQGLLVECEGDLSIPKRKTDGVRAIELASLLDNYNHGLIGPGHCSEERFRRGERIPLVARAMGVHPSPFFVCQVRGYPCVARIIPRCQAGV